MCPEEGAPSSKRAFLRASPVAPRPHRPPGAAPLRPAGRAVRGGADQVFYDRGQGSRDGPERRSPSARQRDPLPPGEETPAVAARRIQGAGGIPALRLQQDEPPARPDHAGDAARALLLRRSLCRLGAHGRLRGDGLRPAAGSDVLRLRRPRNGRGSSARARQRLPALPCAPRTHTHLAHALGLPRCEGRTARRIGRRQHRPLDPARGTLGRLVCHRRRAGPTSPRQPDRQAARGLRRRVGAADA